MTRETVQLPEMDHLQGEAPASPLDRSQVQKTLAGHPIMTLAHTGETLGATATKLRLREVLRGMIGQT